ncbi:thioredoxin [Deinococcus rubellus]|uniref:Thioredoxin n=1 Tax=Deinococcus rubellus TaxID=1889240 RepID=A0ABY5YIX1_9DEIO|nr:thioredoxin fold domain-containing protein [Deinococcus rubellus]UWX64071.1 thioredoxin [Deinococcus rubellus]
MTEALTKPFVLLTQNDCPNCERLKMMLSKPLKGQFDDQIVMVHRQNDVDEFTALTAAHHIQTTPALLHLPSGRVLLNMGGLGEVQRFLAN